MIENRDTLGGDPDREVALDSLAAGIAAADPATVVGNSLSLDGTTMLIDDDRYDLDEFDDVVVVGGGKASGAAGAALEGILGDRIDRGAVVTNNPSDTERIAMLPGDHPVPSPAGVESTERLLAEVDEADADDLVVCLLTGGGSALLSAPTGDVPLADLQTTTERLLASGADIDEINAVRKHLSAVKGGRLARRAAPATVVGLVFSDVVGNHLDVIASGPLTPDESTFDDARDVLRRYDVDVPASVADHIAAGAAGEIPESPGAGDVAFRSVTQYVLADGTTALEAAAETAATAGYVPLVLGDRVRGEAREMATTLVGIAESVHDVATPVTPPAVLLAGGEATVTIRGDGEGGPNHEFVLAGALAVDVPDVTIAAVDTDGIDGVSDAAGAIATRETASPRLEARAALDDNDAGGFLAERDAAIVTGQTDTNVNDLRVLVVGAPNDEST
ncbi:glycerate kinase [Halobacteriales archaeon Cl-PHB]